MDSAPHTAFAGQDPDLTHRILTNLVTALEHAPLDALTLALQQACQNGFGVWMLPGAATRADGRDCIRPGSHLVEIGVLGVQGVGLTVEEAARNWRRAALNLCQGEQAA